MMIRMKAKSLLLFAAILASGLAARAQEGLVDFGSDRWRLLGAEVTEHLGRKSLAGTAVLKDAVFENGVIEVDVAFSGARSYPGVVFRIQRPGENERVYIRPHRSGQAQYPDVVQYVPTFGGVDSWQLYNGEGFTAFAPIPADKWLHVKIEVKGTQARVFVGDGEAPALLIHDLKHGLSKGSVGLSGPKDGSAYFSNFSYRSDETLTFDPPPRKEPTPGAITGWQLSQPFKADQIDAGAYPLTQKLPAVTWKDVKADEAGLVDVSRTFGRLGPSPDSILARTTIQADREETRKYLFGYSDEITVFLNGKALFYGNSAYRYRDPSFLGIAGPFDALYLPLRKGDNELLFLVTESMGGWGFLCVDGSAVYEAPGVRRAWQTEAAFAIPETAVYDPARKVLYVSNYDGYNPSVQEGKQSLSRVSLDGKTVEKDWVAGLKNPVGLAVAGDKLYAVEGDGFAEVDIPSGKLLAHHAVPDAAFLNDVAVGPDGAVYLSDSATGVIFRVAGGKSGEWLKGPEIGKPNGLHISGGKLLIGNNADGRLKSVDLTTKEVRTVADLRGGIIDGIESDGEGNLLVSHWEGRLFKVTPAGEVTRLLDATVPGLFFANFAFVPGLNLAVGPGWTSNRLVAYQLGGR